MRICIGVPVFNIAFAVIAGTSSSGCGSLGAKECVEWYGRSAEAEKPYFKARSCAGQEDLLLCESDEPLPNEERK